jgi:hypothetical protein
MRSHHVRRLRPIAAACAAVGCASIAAATPYASSINDLGSGNFSFFLNETADSAVVKFNAGSPVTIASPTAGLQNFTLPAGATSFSIQVKKSAPSAWALVTTDSYSNNFEIPRGVAINSNPGLDGSFNPWFGTVYATNARNLPTAAGRNVTTGVYVLNPDMTQKFADDTTDFFDDARKGGVDWQNSSGGVSPWRLEVGADNRVYIADWSDAHSGLWAADPAINVATPVLENDSARNADGANLTHGSIADMVVRGSGANRVVYTADEDGFLADSTATTSVHAMSILRYNIGTTATWAGPPTSIPFDNDTQTGGNKLINSNNSIALLPNGHFWISQNRTGLANEIASSLFEVDPATGQVLWKSLDNSPAGTDSANDPFRRIQGIAYDPISGLLALGTQNGGNIIIFDPATKTIITQFAFGGGGTNQDIAFDAAGNLYVSNSAAERVRVWSPGGNWLATTGSDGTFSLAALVPLLAGDITGPNGTPDGIVNQLDLNVITGNWQKTGASVSGDITGPSGSPDGIVNQLDLNIITGNWQKTSGAAGFASSAVPEPAGLLAAAMPGLLLRRRRR